MTDDLRFERLARDWLEAGPVDAPDRAIQAAFFQIDVTPQERRLLLPWRHPMFSTMRSVTIAAVVVLGFGAVMIAQRPSPDGPGASPAAVVAASPTPAPPRPTPPPLNLSTRFASSRFGYSIAVDPAWTAVPATKDWEGYWNDGTDEDQIKIGVSTLTGASQPVRAGETVEQWLSAGFPDQKFGSGCTSDPPLGWTPIQVGTALGRIDTVCSVAQAAVVVHDRVYLFTWGFGGYSDLDGMSVERFKQVLPTVRFNAVPGPSPSP